MKKILFLTAALLTVGAAALGGCNFHNGSEPETATANKTRLTLTEQTQDENPDMTETETPEEPENPDCGHNCKPKVRIKRKDGIAVGHGRSGGGEFFFFHFGGDCHGKPHGHFGKPHAPVDPENPENPDNPELPDSPVQDEN